MKPRGFTLIELLVVVSIIALLSSIVLASVQEGRAKSRNNERLQILDQYRKALELSRDTDGTYPRTDYRCLGNPPSGVCYGSRLTHPALVTALSRYMSPLPLAPAVPSRPAFTGYQYFTCPGPGACTTQPVPTDSYAVFWYMEGATGTCGPGIVTATIPAEDIRQCFYIHK